MKFIHTFWSAPLIKSSLFLPQFDFDAWLLLRLTEYALSVTYVKEYGYKIILVTDEVGYSLFKDIPYDDIIILRGHENDDVTFAAQFKFHAFDYMELGDVLIDGDLFLQERKVFDILEENRTKYDIVYAHNETKNHVGDWHITYYMNVKPVFESVGLCDMSKQYHFPNSPEEMCWPNTSLIQINNKKLMSEYKEQYCKHKNILTGVEPMPGYWFDIIIEQYFLYCLLNNSEYTGMPLMCDDYDSLKNKGDETLGFTHIQSYKHIFHESVLLSLESYNPELLNKIVSKTEKTTVELLKEEIPS